MRKIVASLFTTIDGVVEAPEKWHFPFFNEEMGAAVEAQMSDTQLLGRKSYETFAATWPKREAAGDDAPLATRIGDTRKIVVSNQHLNFTLAQLRAARGRPHRSRQRPQEPARQRHRHQRLGLDRPPAARCWPRDELHLFVDPIAVRDGMRLFDESGTTLPLKLISSTAFSTGVLHVVYGSVESGPEGNYRDAAKAMAAASQQG